MVELVAIIILFGSFIGMVLIIFRKIPLLAELSENSSDFAFRNIFLKLKERIKILNSFQYFFGELFLQKILSKIRILTLRLENKIANYLQTLRERSLQRKIKESDNYWKEIKKINKEKRKKVI